MNNSLQITRGRPMPDATPWVPVELANSGMSISQIVSILWAYRRISILIMVIVLTATALVVKLWPRTYTSSTALMVNYEVNDPANGKDLPIGQLGSYIATQVELMQTPEVLLAVVDHLQLTRNPDYTRGYRDGENNLREWAALQLAKSLAVYQSQRGSQLIYVTASANDPVLAASVANTVVDVYRAQDTQRTAALPAERAKRFASQLETLRLKVDRAQTEVTAFHRERGALGGSTTDATDHFSMMAIEGGARPAARTVNTAAGGAAPPLLDQAAAAAQVQALKTQLAGQEIRLAQVSRHYTPLYPDVQEAQAQVDETRRALAVALQNYDDGAKASTSILRRSEYGSQDVTRGRRANLLARLLLEDQSAKSVLELESAQAVYKRALDSYDEVMFAAAGQFTNIALVSEAKPPVKASKPRVVYGLVGGTLIALLLGLGIPLIYELFNRRVRCRDDIERQYQVPVLAEFGALPLRITS